MPGQPAIRRDQARPTIDRHIRGHDRLVLARDVAAGIHNHREIARALSKKAGVTFTLKDIQEWVNAHEEDIAQVHQYLLGKLAEEVAGLWITNKANRLAEYQAEIEEIRDYLAELRDAGHQWSRSHKDMLHTYLSLFRQTADELGAYPQRASAPARTGQTVHYVIETGDTKALQ